MFLLSIFFSLITNKQFAYSSSTLIQVRLCFECQRSWTWSAFEIWKGLQEPEIISPLFNWYEFVFSCKKKVNENYFLYFFVLVFVIYSLCDW